MMPLDGEIPTVLSEAVVSDLGRTAIHFKLIPFIQQPASSRSWLWLLLLGLFGTLLSVIALSMVISRHASPTPRIEIPQQLLPGNPMPDTAACDDGDPRSRNILYCSYSQMEIRLISFTYDTRARAIILSAILVDDETSIGDLILEWGNPVGYRRGQQDTKIYWKGKTAHLSILGSPVSRIHVILYLPTYCELPTDLLTWHGFVSVDRSPVAAEEASTSMRRSSDNDCE
ncbi:MAG: hypothetical protein KF726_16610 [Anaerolineae bacterium]|nr:hypothetical protein [Anaerolineae bacterium]